MTRDEERVLLAELSHVVADAWESGSPVAGYEPKRWADLARIALRRWQSFGRRNKTGNPDRARRIEGLAKGLRGFDYNEIGLVGPLMTDYRWLAGRLAEVLEQQDISESS